MVLSAVNELHSHVTADQIYHYIKAKYPSIGRGTVYRNLGILVEEGKVRKVFSWIVSVYLCVVFGAFPLYFHNYYYDILVSKYQFYWLSTVAMLASCLIAAIVFACMDLKQFDGALFRCVSTV